LYPSQLLSSGSNELLHGSSSCNPVADFNMAAAASLWRNGLTNFDHVTDRNSSPDAKKRLSPQEFDRGFPPAAMTHFQVGHAGPFDHHGSPSDELRQSLLLRTQLAALRQYQQQQLESAELAKYQVIENRHATRPVTCSSPEPPSLRRAESTATSGSEVETRDADISDRKQSKGGSDKRCGSARSDDSARSRDSKIRRLRSPVSSADEQPAAVTWRSYVSSPQAAATTACDPGN
jgi:hypothetical protein